MTALAADRLRPGLRLSPTVILGPVVLLVAASVFPIYALRDGPGVALDAIQQNAALVAAFAMLAHTAMTGRGTARSLALATASAFVLGAVGVVVWDLRADSRVAPLVTNACFVVAAATISVASARALAKDIDRATALSLGLDAALLFLGTATFVLTVWQPDLRGVIRAQELPAVAGGVALIAGSMAGWVTLLARRVQPGIRGPWALIDGGLLLGLGWLGWLGAAAQGQGASVIVPGDFLLSLGVLLFGYGTATWDVPERTTAQFDRFAGRARDVFPMIAAVGAVGLMVIVPNAPRAAAVTTLGVIVVAAVRTAVLVRSERVGAARLAWETRERADALRSLARLQAEDTPEKTAARMCTEALHLRGIDVAIVDGVLEDGTIVVLGAAGFDLDDDAMLRQPLAGHEAAALLERAAGGPWVESIDPREDARSESPLPAEGLRGIVAAPLLRDGRIVGLISLGTRSPDVAATLADRLATVREFAVVGAALLGPGLASRDRREKARRTIASVIADGAFHPVFQPIVDLASGRFVGFEALTRFDDGIRPDVRFDEATLAGMSVPLEMATLRAALDASSELPDGWLSLNVSPELAEALLPLTAALEGARHAITLEITEHVAVADYGRLMNALGLLRPDLRVAVDDAGAGYACLRHILELRPDFVKLDIGLIRSVDTDLARRAMVASMVTFARDTGCRLIAEGIETAGELAALRDLGVQLGQGYFLARPVPVEELATLDRTALDRTALDRTVRPSAPIGTPDIEGLPRIGAEPQPGHCTSPIPAGVE